MNRDRTAGGIKRWLGVLLAAAMLVGLLPVLAAPQPAAAATTSVTVTRYDAHGSVMGTRTVDYQWMEANLAVQGTGSLTYYTQGPTFDAASFNTVWNPTEDVNVGTLDRYYTVKGTDVKDLCNLAGGATAGCTIRVKAADNFAKWFDYEDVYSPEARQGKLVVCWYDAELDGYVPGYSSGMRLIFLADTSTNPDRSHVFGDWDMHETLPESRWHYYNGQWPSSSGLSVQMVSNIDIYEANMISCNDSGTAKESFAPGETVYVKGAGLAASASYKLWIQSEPVSNNRLSIGGGNDPVLAGAYALDTGEDPSGAQETVATSAAGDFGPTAIWSIGAGASTGTKYDIVADSQSSGTAGKYDTYTAGSASPKDFIDAPGWKGFTVAGSPVVAPVAAFTADVTSGVTPLTVKFTDQSTGSPTSWAWEFGDGATSTAKSPSHTYGTAGTFGVKLTVTNGSGSDAVTNAGLIAVTEPPEPPAPAVPVAAFTSDVTSGDAPLTVQFTDQSTGSPASWAWEFGDGATSTAKSPSHTYGTAGTFGVKLTVTNGAGSDAVMKAGLIAVTEPPGPPEPAVPIAAFSSDVTSGDVPLTVQFTDQSTGSPASWAWDFENDGTVDSTQQSPSHTYGTAGTFSVKLTVTNGAGSDSETKAGLITVNASPTPPEPPPPEPPGSAPALLWGPYLTGTTSAGTSVNVKTDVFAGVMVEYATEAQYAAGGTYDRTATDGTVAQLHHVALSGLEADTVYHYRVSYGAASTADFHFRTFPASGPVTFVVVGDTQDQMPAFSQSERFKLVADSIASQPDVAFVLILGDLVNDGSDTTDWDRFFAAGGTMLANTTVYTALGSHEDDNALYYEAFGVPAYHSFDCGDAHFAVLDSTKGFSAQTAWLDSDLDSGMAWKFVALHHPLYTSDANHFGGYANLRAQWEGLFQTHGVDAVLSGNVHAYERYLENGITYLVMGTGGAPLYGLSDDKYEGYQNSLENSLAYGMVTVDPAAGTSSVRVVRVADVAVDNAEVTTVHPPGAIFEAVMLEQSANQPGWDLNGDQGTDICDVVLMGLHWGEQGEPGWIPEDVNHDGEVDELDVAVLDRNWTEARRET